MELNELFEKYSIETISNKTKIPKEKLESLKELKFGDFREPQLIGFLNIINREFGVDVEDLKAEVKRYYQEHKSNKSVASIDMIDSEVSSEHKDYYITKFLYILTIAALAYAGWYYYDRENTSNIENKDCNSSVISDTIDGVKNLLGIDAKNKLTPMKVEDKAEENSSKTVDINASENNKTEDIKENETISATKQEELNNNTQNSIAKSNTDEKKEKFNISDNETNNEDKNVATNDTNSIKKTVDTLLEENDSLKNAKDKNETNEKNKSLATETNVSEESTTAEPKAIIEDAKMVSKAKALWVGIYNLDTKKRIVKVLKRDRAYDLNLNNDKYAIVTGHNKFELVTDNETKTFPKKGKVYLLISKDEGVKILTRKEYRKVTNRRAW